MIQNSAADMHIHSNESDGTLKPEEIIRVAQKINNLKAISITYHDTAQGSRIALDYMPKNIEVIAGIEFSCERNDEEVHILGYFIDVYNKFLLETEEKLLNIRALRIEKFIEKLNGIKIKISIDDVYKFSTGKAVGRPHVAQAIFHKGYTKSVDEAYCKYLIKESETYVPRIKMDVEQAMEVINLSGGVSVIAHPSSVKNRNTISEIINIGIQGIEAYHPMNSPDSTLKYLNLAKENNLFITGGSDFHNSRQHDKASMGECTVDYYQIEKIKNYLKFRQTML
ncbi:MAG: PHP domain-containing protein [Eubacteriaceae bacterium]|nr:PHP domain-containing protein [Eubacteriaceae bacterium]